jgi:ribA/ribD-fused uncharacterized protein
MEMEVPKELVDFLDVARRDQKAELECKLLSGRIQTKDVADRLLNAIKTLSIGPPVETNLLRIMYPDDIRVEVEGPLHIQKVCAGNSFKGVPVLVQRKGGYYARLQERTKKDTLDVADFYTRFTLRFEEEIRRDWDASPTDARVQMIRLLSRKSFKTPDGYFQIDFSMVKSRRDKRHTLRDVLKESHVYELEIEFLKKESQTSSADIAKSLQKIVNTLLQAYQQSPFILGDADQMRYAEEIRLSGAREYNAVTMERRHLNETRDHHVLSGYTVTNKADGERACLYVARDRKVLKTKNRFTHITWTGITATSDAHVGDLVDGEFIPDRNLFCIFDVYHYKGRNTQQLPLMKTDEDTIKTPLSSRLGCAKLFVEDLRTEFVMQPSSNPIRIETKLFLAGDGSGMYEAINTLLNTKFEYENDGLIFTPRLSPVAPPADSRGDTWLYVYKWKPAYQNSIDFLLRFTGEKTYDPVLNTEVRKGDLYVKRTPKDDVIVYPCETMTGEYVPPRLPEDMEGLGKGITTPTLFQPSTPRNPDAYKIYVPIDDRGIAYDQEKNRVDDNTLVECRYDTEKNRWTIMRTRYDKTYKYRVKKEPEYGNAVFVAQSIWTSIHVPVSEEMIRGTVPVDDSMEDETYYREDDNRRTSVLAPVRKFHNRIKESLYLENVKEGDTLLELAVGRVGDFNKMKKVKVSKVVGIDMSPQNLQMACRRVLEDRIKYPMDSRPYMLFIKGDMTEPLYEQESHYYSILAGKEKASTKYLEQFEGLTKFDAVACQFAMHYACESEETFRAFVRNVDTHCKSVFFGTCSDGASIYSLLMGRKNYIFTNGRAVGAEYVKEYEDREIWTEEFGMPIKVSLETVDSPQREYLVPFGKVSEIFAEHGFELVESNLFSELYTRQTAMTLAPEQQMFSFLNRAFTFRRAEKKKEEEEKKEGEVEKRDEKEEEKEKPEKKTRKLRKGGAEPTEIPVLFLGAGEDHGEFRAFSNDAEYPIEIEGVSYPTVEHYYQAMKAREFGDSESEKRILEARTPKAAKAMGRKVKNFMKEVWDEKRREIMLRAVKAKFVQHPELQKQLLDTGKRPIGKADPRNTFWGIGTGVASEKSNDPTKWRGQNQLGKMLMSFREDFTAQV